MPGISRVIMTNIVAYYRVSTQKQGQSGLGLADQKERAHLYGNIVAEYVEIETGKNSNRPVIAQAIAHARSAGCTLYIACLDRLARNVHFISGLMESGVEFVCGDCPTASRFTIHILAAVAEEEARKIGERTRNGLAQAKKKGVLLGSNNPKWKASRLGNPGLDKARIASVKSRRKKAEEFYSYLLPEILKQRDEGKTLKQIATQLNESGHLTRALKPYTQPTLSRILKYA